MKRPLVIVASEKEGLSLVQTWALDYDSGFALFAGDHERALGLYRGSKRDLVISGVLEHHMTAACARAVADLSPYAVVNFGACGSYDGRLNGSTGPQIGEAVVVADSYRFDVDDNAHWAPRRVLKIPDLDVRQVACVTGSRYSRAKDREAVYFPHCGEIEDMELYALAVLLETLEVPLYSIKYVTNQVGSEGRNEYRQNVVSAMANGERALQALLSILESDTH